MKLGDLLTAETKINNEILIGRELELLDGELLLLAIQNGEFFVEEEEAVVPATRLLALYDPLNEEEDEAEDEDDWEDEENWEDDLFGEDEEEFTTNRQAIMNERDEYEPELLDVSEIVINGEHYTVYEAEESWMDGHPHDAVLALKRADEAGIVSEKWQDKSLEDLAMIEYIVQDELMNVAWRADILSIGVEFSEEDESGEVLCGKVFNLPCGRFEEPVTFDITAPSGEIVEARIYGIYMLDVWKDAELLGLDEEDLEEMCAPDERLLAVEYDADADVLMNFYTKDFLDEEARAGDELPELVLGTADHELRLVDVVPADFDEEVELELMSYEIFED
jgi:hypothetical protein